MSNVDGITFIIPAYNAGRYLSDAIVSILKSFSCSPAQIIVVDDGSTDATSEIATTAGVRLVRHPSNRGIASTLNTGMALAETEYVAWLSADDMYVDGALHAVEKALATHPGADLYFGNYRLLKPDGAIVDERPSSNIEPITPDLMTKDWFVDLLFASFINGSTTIIRRKRLIELGLFDATWRYAQDYAMWLLMAYHRSSAVYIPEPIGLRRVHGEQLSRDLRVQHRTRHEDSLLLGHYLSRGGFARVVSRMDNIGGDIDINRALFIKKLWRVGLMKESIRMFAISRDKARLVRLVITEMLSTIRRRLAFG